MTVKSECIIEVESQKRPDGINMSFINDVTGLGRVDQGLCDDGRYA